MKDKEKQIEEMAKHGCYDGCASGLRKFCDEYDGKPCKNMIRIASGLYEQGYRKISENEVVIDKNENPCLSCPVPEDIQRDVDCSTICGAVRLGIDWQNQCKVLVKENKQLTKELARASKETAEKILEFGKKFFKNYDGHYNEGFCLFMAWIETQIENGYFAKQFGLEIKE